MAGKIIFSKNCPTGQNFIEISVSRTVSEINVFLHFTQKFKKAVKNGKENNFWQKVTDDSAYTLHILNATAHMCQN